ALTVHTRASIGLADWETAHTTATKLVALGPGEPEALELLGLVSVELGNAEEATRCFVELGKLQPTLAGPLLGRALVTARLEGDRGRAIATLRRARVLDPTLDLTTLLLKPEWTSLAEDQEFVTALNTLLAELRASE
ncbi:MAG: hypothetical protein KDA24_14545, partial [Deltaproteobacteria bacterium]|nr:hypothetical protein [Deltaproteobacteria bacterium]